MPVKQTLNHLSTLITDYTPCLQLTCPLSHTQHTISIHTQVNTQLKRSARASLNSWTRLGGDPDPKWRFWTRSPPTNPLQHLLRWAGGSERLTLKRLDSTEAKVEPKQNSVWSEPAGQRRVQLGLPAVCALESKSRQISPTDITSQINEAMSLYTDSDGQLLCKRENASKNHHLLKRKFL